MIFQMHPDHGRHIAYSPQEAQANHKNGWVTVTKEEYYDIGQKVEENINNDLVTEYEEKFGEKPHHRMKPETIREKLDE